MNLTAEGRKEGRKAMEDGLTKAARVRRRLRGGRPRNVKVQNISALDALHYLVTEAERGRDLMREAELNPDDLQLRLAYRKLEQLASTLLPPPGGALTPFFEKIEKLAAEGAIFLGIIWSQLDHEVVTAPGMVRKAAWATPFLGDKETDRSLRALAAYHEN